MAVQFFHPQNWPFWLLFHQLWGSFFAQSQVVGFLEVLPELSSHCSTFCRITFLVLASVTLDARVALKPVF